MLKILKFFYPLVTIIYLWWSRSYRSLFLRKYSDTTVPRYKEPPEVLGLTQKVKWHPDGLLQLYDVVGTAQRFQYILNEVLQHKTQPDVACDCDDFASYCALALHPRFNARIMLVAWTKPHGGIGGHAICAFNDASRTKGPLCHIGNWGLQTGYYDYPMLAKDIVRQAGGSELIGYTLTDYALSSAETLIVRGN